VNGLHNEITENLDDIEVKIEGELLIVIAQQLDCDFLDVSSHNYAGFLTRV